MRRGGSGVAAAVVAWARAGERDGRPTDVIVVPGGRNGALSTARITRQAALIGASVVVAADRESVTSGALAAESLGVVARRGPAASL